MVHTNKDLDKMTLTPNATKTREQFFTALYKTVFPRFAAFVSKNNGSFNEAKDTFQDALVIYYEKTRLEVFTDRQGHRYLVGIARHLWYKQYRKSNTVTTLTANELYKIEDSKAQTPSTEKLISFLEHAGQKCMEMLRAFYYDKLPLDQFTSAFGFGNERSATVQKYKCLEKVRHQVKEKQMTYEDFIE